MLGCECRWENYGREREWMKCGEQRWLDTELIGMWRYLGNGKWNWLSPWGQECLAKDVSSWPLAGRHKTTWFPIVLVYLYCSTSHHRMGHLVLSILEAKLIKTMTKEVQLSGEGYSPPAGWYLVAASCRGKRAVFSYMEVEGKLADYYKKPLILVAREEPHCLITLTNLWS